MDTRRVDGSFSFVEVNGLRARALRAGRGDPVVVLHGWGGRIESIAAIVSCLQPVFSVVALDLPGFGESPPPEAAWGTPDYARFVTDAMDRFEIERAGFVGHSFGAKTALYVAGTRPERVDKLVLQAASGLRTPPSLRVAFKRALSKTGRSVGRAGPAGRAVRDALYDRIASRDYQEAGALRPILVRVVNEDLRDLLPRIQAPTLLIWGTRDDAVPLAHGQTMDASIPDSGLVLFEGAGHFAYLDEPERFCRIVRHFLGAPVI